MRKMKIPIRRPWIPTIILVISLLITSLVTLYVLRATEALDQLRFESTVQETQNSIDNRIESYIALLRGATGLVSAHPDITQEEFSIFVRRLQLSERYPGIQGIGYVMRVPQDEKAAFLDTMHAQGQESYTITPDKEASEYYPVVYLEPSSKKSNQASIGFDMSSETTRFQAMKRARDSGLRTVSGKINLIQEPQETKQAGFDIFIPIFEGSDVPLTFEQRREKLEGFIFAPFRADDILTGILGDQSKLLISYQVYDGKTIDKKNLLHDSQTLNKNPSLPYLPRYRTTRQIDAGGETWTLAFATDPQFEKLSQRGISPFIFLGGLLTSTTLFLLSRSQFVARTVAEQSASKLRYSQKELQKAIGLRDNFISIASHELKTPVTSLKLYTEVLNKSFIVKKETKAAEYMGKMNKQIDKLTVLIQDLLDVSRLQSGQLAFREEEFSLNAMVNDVIENTKPIATRHDLIIKGHIQKNVWGDKDRIGQVLSNFLTNAIKYSPKAKKVVVHLEEKETMAMVTVQDFGIGIGTEHQKKIFNKFYRVTDANEQTFPGLGMGLYICNEIIKRHGGEIIVESIKNKGSSFSFTIPYYSKNNS